MPRGDDRYEGGGPEMEDVPKVVVDAVPVPRFDHDADHARTMRELCEGVRGQVSPALSDAWTQLAEGRSLQEVHRELVAEQRLALVLQGSFF